MLCSACIFVSGTCITNDEVSMLMKSRLDPHPHHPHSLLAAPVVGRQFPAAPAVGGNNAISTTTNVPWVGAVGRARISHAIAFEIRSSKANCRANCGTLTFYTLHFRVSLILLSHFHESLYLSLSVHCGHHFLFFYGFSFS